MSQPDREKIKVLAQVAGVWATMSTCPRLSAGAVIFTGEYHQISSGYNGAPVGQEHCNDVGCLVIDGHCMRTIHAEHNAVLQVGRVGSRGCSLLCTHKPCLRCTQLIIQVGITRVYYTSPYGPGGEQSEADIFLKRANIHVYQVGR